MKHKKHNFNLYIINGCNLDKLGEREPHIYGGVSLLQIEDNCRKLCEKNNIKMQFFQSNFEAEIIEKIHEANQNADAIIINAAAFTHTSIAIRDALLMAEKTIIIEVHLSNIFKREKFRHKSYISDIAQGIVAGFGDNSYLMAIHYLINKNNC